MYVQPPGCPSALREGLGVVLWWMKSVCMVEVPIQLMVEWMWLICIEWIVSVYVLV